MQFISDGEGKTAGVFIPIDEWNRLKERFKELLDEDIKVPEWQMTEVRERMTQYEKGQTHYLDFDSAMDDIEKGL